MKRNKLQINDICTYAHNLSTDTYLVKVLDAAPVTPYDRGYCVLVTCIKNEGQCCIGFNRIMCGGSATGVVAASMNNDADTLYRLNDRSYEDSNVYDKVPVGFMYYALTNDLTLVCRKKIDMYTLFEQEMNK